LKKCRSVQSQSEEETKIEKKLEEDEIRLGSGSYGKSYPKTTKNSIKDPYHKAGTFSKAINVPKKTVKVGQPTSATNSPVKIPYRRFETVPSNNPAKCKDSILFYFNLVFRCIL
jgi:hypothetical protein